MTSMKYWAASLQFYKDTFTAKQQYRFQLAGAFAELAMRERGSSLLPFVVGVGNSPPSKWPDDPLIALGMTALALSKPARR